MKKKLISQRHEFSNWLNPRINSASKPEQTAVQELLDMSFNRGQYYKQRFAKSIEQKALDQGKADPSDPFVVARTLAHFHSGVAKLDDYDVKFRNETREVASATGSITSQEFPGNPLMQTVEVAHSVKRL